MYDVAIIGAGISGATIARELSRYQLRVVLIEKENDVALGTTRANSAIVHAGYDARPGTDKARFCVAGNALYEDLCQELAVPFRRNGSLVAAFSESEMASVRELYQRGQLNGVQDLQILDRAQVLALAPKLRDTVVGALYAPSAAIVGPWELTIALVENALQNGVELRLDSPVVGLEKAESGLNIQTKDQVLTARWVVNCTGVNAARIHGLLTEPEFEIIPSRGEYLLFDKSAGDFTACTLFGIPGDQGKGVVLLPTVHGNLMLGPNAEADSSQSVETTAPGLKFIREWTRDKFVDIPFNQVITAFAGLRAKTNHGDFELGLTKVPGLINVAGIASPGLTAAPAIARHIVQVLADQLGELTPKSGFQRRRQPPLVFMGLDDEDKAALVAEDPRFGRIICRCEQITEGEIVAAIHTNPGAVTVDGIKRRVRPGSGRCQGGFCAPRVMEILARELNRDITEILKDRTGSYILTGLTKAAGEEEA